MSLRLFGVRLEISVLFLASVTVMLLMDASGVALWAMAAACLHELGHVAALFALRDPPQVIALTPFGMRMTWVRKGRQSYWRDLLVAAAGPLVNLGCFLLFWLLSLVTRSPGFLLPACASLAIGVYNLLPVLPLDGGQILFDLLSLPLGEGRAKRLLQIVSFVVLTAAAFFGFVLLLRSRYNFTLLFTSLYLIAMLLTNSE